MFQVRKTGRGYDLEKWSRKHSIRIDGLVGNNPREMTDKRQCKIVKLMNDKLGVPFTMSSMV